MLKRYRRRFVASTMALSSLVLIVALAVQFIMLYRNTWSEMKNTMSLVVGPWDEPGENFRAVEPRDREYPTDGGEAPVMPDRLNRNTLSDRDREQIITAFYYPDADSISIPDRENGEYDSALIYDAVIAAENREESFGVIREMGLVYYREASPKNVKYAFADISYVRTRLLRGSLELLGILVAALILFYFISLWLSKRAARPMEQALEMERQFVADISHDLKTPITVISANNSILRSDPEAKVGSQQQWLESTDAAVKNMMQLIEEMLTLSTLESATKTVRHEPVDLSHIAEKCSLQLESVAYDRGIKLETEIAENVRIMGDPEFAERICTGLLDNALKYEPNGGHVKAELTQHKKKALYRVTNAGSVIAPEDLQHIFERFYRGDKTRNLKKGYGLGLPIVQQMVTLMGGEIGAESSAENGTVFTVTFASDAD